MVSQTAPARFRSLARPPHLPNTGRLRRYIDSPLPETQLLGSFSVIPPVGCYTSTNLLDRPEIGFANDRIVAQLRAWSDPDDTPCIHHQRVLREVKRSGDVLFDNEKRQTFAIELAQNVAKLINDSR